MQLGIGHGHYLRAVRHTRHNWIIEMDRDGAEALYRDGG